MWKSSVNWSLVVALGATFAPQIHASTGYEPPRWLDQGGVAAEHSPEFYWEIEVRKIAAPFKPEERRIPAAGNDGETLGFAEQLSRADLDDFIAAKKSPAALDQHKAARDAISAANEATTTTLPAEEPSEFADYHRGAFAFRRGAAHYAEAASAWETLLQRPAAERHYRSVWAAFMLGKLALYGGKPDAVKWFQRTRQLAKDGFADSLGLAADSYGWEARSELDQGHVETAAKLYLTQLALGDDSAIVSLKALVPDRTPIDGMMNFGPLPPENADEAAMQKFEQERAARDAEAVVRAARDPLLRRITSAHVLATETVGEALLYLDESRPLGERCKSWLAAVEKAGVTTVDDAVQLGWVAYSAGSYGEAGRWLKLNANESSAAAHWLKAKLLRRDGKLNDAADAMAAAWKGIRADQTPARPSDDESIFNSSHYGLSPLQSASGDLGALQLTRGDFIAAYEVFDVGGMPEDAAFVAEHVLTCDELKQSVDARYPWGPEQEAKAPDHIDRWDTEAPKGFVQRWMLGRRLVREDRYAEARAYLPAKYREVLDHYVSALKEGANEKLPKAKRARAWFDAAVIARYDGMELMGTEVEPDNFRTGGAFEASDVAGQRETAKVLETTFDNDGKEVSALKPVKIYVPVTPEEKKRLAANRPSPNKRFHYRYIAAAIAWKAALLLPDQSKELADVLNSGGNWIKGDNPAADKFFQAIEHRASKTKVGIAAGKAHWFVPSYGPWSEAPKE